MRESATSNCFASYYFFFLAKPRMPVWGVLLWTTAVSTMLEVQQPGWTEPSDLERYKEKPDEDLSVTRPQLRQLVRLHSRARVLFKRTCAA